MTVFCVLEYSLVSRVSRRATPVVDMDVVPQVTGVISASSGVRPRRPNDGSPSSINLPRGLVSDHQAELGERPKTYGQSSFNSLSESRYIARASPSQTTRNGDRSLKLSRSDRLMTQMYATDWRMQRTGIRRVCGRRHPRPSISPNTPASRFGS